MFCNVESGTLFGVPVFCVRMVISEEKYLVITYKMYHDADTLLWRRRRICVKINVDKTR